MYICILPSATVVDIRFGVPAVVARAVCARRNVLMVRIMCGCSLNSQGVKAPPDLAAGAFLPIDSSIDMLSGDVRIN